MKDNKDNIVLIGMMGTSKTTSGKILAIALGMNFIDTDSLIELETHTKIAKLFEKGEAFFRQIEAEVVKKVAAQNNCVIACGGGVPLREENMLNLASCGKIIHLTANAQTIYERVKTDASRPLLNGDMSVARILQLHNERAEKYKRFADFTIDNSLITANECADKIIEFIKVANCPKNN